jgi:pyruvate dehydrogenase E1 component alpha subunit
MLDLADAWCSMNRMRRFEEAVAAGVASGEIHGEMHVGLGQEAIAAGIEPLLRPTDAVVSTHRPHLHALAHGVPPVPLLAELFERAGMCRGKGGHMHLFDSTRPFMCTGIVGASAPIALGYAFAFNRRGDESVAVAVLGDGAVNSGAFAESLNMAALWSLPVVFLVEDNGYGISVARDRSTAGPLVARGEPFGIAGASCDGTDVEDVFRVAVKAFADARGGAGPALIVATCYRYSGHYEGDADRYRPQAEKQAAMSPERDPLMRLQARMLDAGHPQEELDALAAGAARDVAGWLSAALAYPPPDRQSAFEGVFA